MAKYLIAVKKPMDLTRDGLKFNPDKDYEADASGSSTDSCTDIQVKFILFVTK